VLAFGVYCANRRTLPTGDSAATALIPVVLLTQGNLRMDGYAGYYIDHFGRDSTHCLVVAGRGPARRALEHGAGPPCQAI
jgi:hypothetical protein